MSKPIHIVAFYKFVPINEDAVQSTRDDLYAFGESRGMRGLTLVAAEGINGTVCGTPDAIKEWKEHIVAKFGDMIMNDSYAEKLVFPRWHVKVRSEIVTLKNPEVQPNAKKRHLSPAEWNKRVENDDAIILDTRNTYETEVGMFERAIDPKIDTFTEFKEFVQKANLPKDREIYMYCTGGIRCEKALIEMEKQGYENVYQLEGGILSYMKEFPEGKFKGECFVFDHRVAVDTTLEPSARYKLCPHCGDPGDLSITCDACSKDATICKDCEHKPEQRTCSKACKRSIEKSLIAA